MARGGATGASSSRGRGKFKVSRGGGRHFSRDISVVDHGMETLGLEDEGSDSDEESSEEESESSDDGLGGGGGAQASARAEPEMTRAERKALKKAQSGKKKGQPGPGDLPGSSDEESEGEPLPDRNNMGPSKREKEASAQKQASEHYAKMHAAGKTDQFKKDMERLKEVKQRREKEAAERKAKDEEAKKEAEEKKQVRLAGKR